jgi:selenobiotic family peptide radical SAM maturase
VLRASFWSRRRTGSFTLQWHLTNACGASCKHCYDRSPRAVQRLPAALAVLDDLAAFCARHRLRGHLCLTGGDPFLHPEFWEIYAAATARQLRTSILGNPVPGEVLDRLVAIQDPLYYQVSLEGLAAHDDVIRGEGHFASTLAFLEAARARAVTTHVMVTLTRENLGEVLPLARALRGRTDRVSFNRLARVGAGAALAAVSREELGGFLDGWVAEARRERHLGWKDNLLNVARARAGLRPFPGCTGHGCGAAFDFVALLPDGEVHACRKLPSPLGRLPEQRLEEVWRSPEARRHRRGSAGCRGCALRERCGGCLAVTHGEGLDPFTTRDPHCPGPLPRPLPTLRGERGDRGIRR